MTLGKSGNLIIVWHIRKDLPNNGYTREVQGRIYSRNGAAVSNRFAVNPLPSNETSYAWFADVEADQSGNFVVVYWQDKPINGNSRDTIRARRFNSAGVALDNNFIQVSTIVNPDSSQVRPAIAMEPNGHFIVVWESLYDSSGNDTADWSIQMRRFRPDGSALDKVERQVNEFIESSQGVADVDVASSGKVVVTFQSNLSPETDQDVTTILKTDTVPSLPFFSDGFESGGTSRWSGSTGGQ
jgi:hypothetical protein